MKRRVWLNGIVVVGLLLAGLAVSAAPRAAQAAPAPEEAARSSALMPETVSAGGYHTCGLETDGTLQCWGDDSFGQVSGPNGSTATFTQVSAGIEHTCGLETDGTLQCWGRNDEGQVSGPNGSTASFTQVSAGGYHTCGLETDGTLQCWGYDYYGQVSGPNGSTATFTQVSAGLYHTCGLKTDGTLQCWGRNDYGQATPPPGTFAQVSAGRYHTCGLKTDGTLQCWGQVSGPNGSTATFTQVSASLAWSQWHTCGLETDGTLQCWGDDFYGQVSGPNGSTATFTQVSAGGYHTCGLETDGTLQCWGYDYYGQVSGPNGSTATFTQRRVSAGLFHTCGLKTDGTLQCWGSDEYGKISGPNGSTASFTQVSAGGYQTCGLETDGTLQCWGWNAWGQVSGPNGSTASFTQVSAGGYQTCGLETDGTLQCWGDDSYGQVSGPNGSTATFAQVSAGMEHTCGLKTDGTLQCWGSDEYGKISGPNGSTASFTQVSAGGYQTCGLKTHGTLQCWGQVSGPNGSTATFTQVSAGLWHTCGLETDGTLQCWGDDFYGSVSGPNGSTASFTQVSAGLEHTCGLETDATLQCWGWNDYGQAPRVAITPASVPDGWLGTAYGQNLYAAGGAGPYTFSLVAGALPGGLSLSPGGLLSGTPTDGGTFNFTVQATDSSFPISGQKAYTLLIDTNQPPEIAADASEVTVDEGDTATNTGTISDPNNDDVTLTASVGTVENNGDGAWSWSFETDDGPADSQMVTIYADDGYGGTAQVTFALTVNNVAPTATFSNDGPVDEGSSFTLSLASPTDPSSADTTAGFEYAFDCGDGSSYGGWSGTNTATCPTDDNGMRTAKGKIKDKDGGETEYTDSLTINNVAPSVGPIAVDQILVQVGTEVNVSAAFTDPGTADTHTATCDWGDGTIHTGPATSPVSDSHSYTAAGVYTVQMTVTDDDDGSGQSVFQYVVVYDPSAGFVTGGGWIDSPEGAYKPDPSLTGKANFGFVSRYKRGATVPTGNTEFQFHAADLNFHSDSYEWLVVTGSDYARFKGVGTINGEGAYKFMLWAGDADPDTFRIKIWTEDEVTAVETVIYDNGFDQAVAGGSIVIHK